MKTKFWGNMNIEEKTAHTFEAGREAFHKGTRRATAADHRVCLRIARMEKTEDRKHLFKTWLSGWDFANLKEND